MTVCVIKLGPEAQPPAAELAATLRHAGVGAQVRTPEGLPLAPRPPLHFVAPVSAGVDPAEVHLLRRRIGAAVFVVLGPDEPLLRKRMLDAGADDYLRLDTPVRGLLARLAALERLGPNTPPRNGAFGDLRVGLYRGDVEAGAQPLSLSELEYRALSSLVDARGEVIPRDELLMAIWGEREISDNALDACMHRLRAKLANSRSRVRLLTVRGLGYRLDRGR